jgi:lipopolysaccharide transport system ATP-binding protein
MSSIIQVEGLSKRYIIGHQQLKGKKTFREAISRNIARMGGKFIHPFSKNISSNSPFEEFWALNDINFNVEQGDRIGIIGRNGAGKSTLLKVLSRITEPTSGKITIRGRVASLLEVGTGFNSELTGRENIFLNGAILGMHRAEIKQKFDEIVEFSGVEKFLDTPVKRYSSGMYVRLAFAVAAHLEPEILIVDEVLAVGDAEFQKKCLGKMQDVSKNDGRTVLFVSHNLAAIQLLCNKVIVLQNGRKIFDGSTNAGIEYYINNNVQPDQLVSLKERTDRQGNGKIRIVDFSILDEQGNTTDEILSGNTYTFRLGYENYTKEPVNKVYISIDIHSQDDRRQLMLVNMSENKLLDIDNETGYVYCKITNFPLAVGRYYFVLFIACNGYSEVLDTIANVCSFEVIGGDFFGTGSLGYPNNCRILHRSNWSID